MCVVTGQGTLSEDTLSSFLRQIGISFIFLLLVGLKNNIYGAFDCFTSLVSV